MKGPLFTGALSTTLVRTLKMCSHGHSVFVKLENVSYLNHNCLRLLCLSFLTSPFYHIFLLLGGIAAALDIWGSYQQKLGFSKIYLFDSHLCQVELSYCQPSRYRMASRDTAITQCAMKVQDQSLYCDINLSCEAWPWK